ncbi:hypothetical protein CEXT_193531 [Caerostris extrusa]|uniref:Uncharacterized protein n=1 Tax=Caerostris extrusa TaxID=172846 RepID=A0AAV4WUY7_CAEEX|nr:hypothetical protein CEXT_193531 [Caerostris extrusa]
MEFPQDAIELSWQGYNHRDTGVDTWNESLFIYCLRMLSSYFIFRPPGEILEKFVGNECDITFIPSDTKTLRLNPCDEKATEAVCRSQKTAVEKRKKYTPRNSSEGNVRNSKSGEFLGVQYPRFSRQNYPGGLYGASYYWIPEVKTRQTSCAETKRPQLRKGRNIFRGMPQKKSVRRSKSGEFLSVQYPRFRRQNHRRGLYGASYC